MELVDTLVELHRDVVSKMGSAEFDPIEKDEPFEETVRLQVDPLPVEQDFVIKGRALVNLDYSGLWFLTDPQGRRFAEHNGIRFEPPPRHIAVDLLFQDSRIVAQTLEHEELGELDITVVTGSLEPETIRIPDGPRQGEEMTVPPNEIPLLGRLTVHDHLEIRDLERDPAKNERDIALDFAPQDRPSLEAGAPPDRFVSHLFGSSIDANASGDRSGRVVIGDHDPRVVWVLDYAERFWIVNCFLGRALVRHEMAESGSSQSEAEVVVLDRFADKLNDEAQKTLGERKTKFFLSESGDPIVVDPTGEAEDSYREFDAVCQEWERGSGIEESLAIQLRERNDLTESRALPASVLAMKPGETVGLANAVWTLLRKERDNFAHERCQADTSAFSDDEPFRLAEDKNIKFKAGGRPVTMHDIEVVIEDQTDEQPGRIVGHGALTADIKEIGIDVGDVDATFEEVGFQVTLDDIPREFAPDEAKPEGVEQTLGEIKDLMAAKSETIRAANCDGAEADVDKLEEEIEELENSIAQFPRTIGIALTPQPEEPVIDSDFDPNPFTAAAAALVTAFLGGLASISLAFLAPPLVLYFAHRYISGVAFDLIMENLKRKPGTKELPLGHFAPSELDLDSRMLRVYFRELPESLRVSCIKADSSADEDDVIQAVGGILPDGRPWKLSVNDAADRIVNGQQSLVIDPAFTNGEVIAVEVATSRSGRRYLRSHGDAATTNNLAELPPCR